MALVARVPRSCVESHYGAAMSLRVDDGGDGVSGTYVPLSSERRTASAASGTNGSTVTQPALRQPSSLLDGKVSVDGESVSITGRWKYTVAVGQLVSGVFFVNRGADDSSFSGWWASDGDEETRYAWTWETTDQAIVSVPTAPMATESRGALSRIVNSVRFAQFGVLAAWLFAAITVAQVVLVYLPANSIAAVASAGASLAFNSVYSLFYALFLVGYALLQAASRPPPSYVLGVFLYTLGYCSFAGYFALSLHGIISASSSVATVSLHTLLSWLNVIGSALFFVGSCVLVSATIPPREQGTGEDAVKLGAKSKKRHRWCGSPAASLFWGCTSFLIGSALLIVDAVRGASSATHGLLMTATTIFLVGRFCFIHGSTSPECGVFLQPRPPRKCVPAP